MADRGYVAISRWFFDHPIFAAEALTEREAFQWMIMEAAWEPRRVRRGRVVIDLGRGEFAHSIRFMATAWKWSEAHVRRFLKKLKSDGMLTIQPTHDVTHVTVCNYEKFQNPRRTDDAQSDAQTDAGATRERRKLEPLNHLTSNQNNTREPTAIEELQQTLDLARSRAVVEHRKKIRKPLTPYGARKLAAKFALATDPNAAADAMIANGWQGFEPEWLLNRSARGHGPPGRTIVDAAMDMIAEKERGKTIGSGTGNVIELISATRGQP